MAKNNKFFISLISNLTHLVAAVGLLLLAGCGTTNDVIYQGGFDQQTTKRFLGIPVWRGNTETTQLGTISTRADRSAIIFQQSPDVHFAARPQPDAMEQIARQTQLLAELSGKLKAGDSAEAAIQYMDNVSTIVADLAKNGQGILYLREARYMLIEGYLNGAFTNKNYTDALNHALSNSYAITYAEVTNTNFNSRALLNPGLAKIDQLQQLMKKLERKLDVLRTNVASVITNTTPHGSK